MLQRDYFLNGEGDNWFLRNKHLVGHADNYDIKFLARNLCNLKDKNFNFLEIGCSNGIKTSELATLLGWKGFGIDPSTLAIDEARQIKRDDLSFFVGTAESLPFEDNVFDLVYFAFCLYLIDREQLEDVFIEAMRVLKQNSFLAILDFDFGVSKKNTYIHNRRLYSFKESYAARIESFGFVQVAKESYSSTGKMEFANNPDERIAINLYIHVPE